MPRCDNWKASVFVDQVDNLNGETTVTAVAARSVVPGGGILWKKRIFTLAKFFGKINESFCKFLLIINNWFFVIIVIKWKALYFLMIFSVIQSILMI